jgi:hypothetical protein
MLLFAAATTLDRMHRIPADFWWKLAAAVGAVIALVIILRKVAKMNKVVLAVVVGLVVVIGGFNWIYERNEPSWATPAVNFLSGWFPTKGKVEQKKSGL